MLGFGRIFHMLTSRQNLCYGPQPLSFATPTERRTSLIISSRGAFTRSFLTATGISLYFSPYYAKPSTVVRDYRSL